MEKRAHEDSQRALEGAKDRAAGLVTDLDCERSERGRLQREESRLQTAVAETSAVLEDLKRTAAEQAAALEAARRLEEAARKDAERALQSEQDAAARALERETARLFQEQASGSTCHPLPWKCACVASRDVLTDGHGGWVQQVVAGSEARASCRHSAGSYAKRSSGSLERCWN